MRSYMSLLYGNQATKEQLGRSAEKDALSHALIIEGASGSGKKTLVRELIAAALCEKRHDGSAPLPCRSCRACRLVAENKAADVRFISRGDKATLGVDNVRAEKADMYLAPIEFERKFYVFEDAHTMTVQAQNALLIALEEPPKNVHIILLCESADALLTTVKSRARLYKMQRFSEDEILTWLSRERPLAVGAYSEKRTELYTLLTEADGCIGRALSLLEEQNAAELFRDREVTDKLLSALGSHSFAKLCTAFSLLPSKREELILGLTSLLRALRDLILLKRADGVTLSYFPFPDAIPPECRALRMQTLLSALEAVEETIRSLERNASSATALNLLKYTLKKV